MALFFNWTGAAEAIGGVGVLTAAFALGTDSARLWPEANGASQVMHHRDAQPSLSATPPTLIG